MSFYVYVFCLYFSSNMTDDSPHLQTRPKYTNLPHCKVATSMQICPKYILAPLFRVMHYEWAAWTKEVCFSNQFKLINFSALHVLPCEPCSVTWREGSAIDRRTGPQTTEDMLSESPQFPAVFRHTHSMWNTTAFSEKRSKSRSHRSMQNISILSGVQPWTSRTFKVRGTSIVIIITSYWSPHPSHQTTLPRTSCW